MVHCYRRRSLQHQVKAIAICHFSDILLRAPSEDGDGVLPTFWIVHSIFDGTFQVKETRIGRKELGAKRRSEGVGYSLSIASYNVIYILNITKNDLILNSTPENRL